jgi:hypothetical protein
VFVALCYSMGLPALSLNITGRIMAAILGVCLMFGGISLTITLAGAPIGIPFTDLDF